ncbi:MAG: hypothetical protein ACOYL6_17050 [Bacteriovoracaceae bacterium]
MKKLPLFLFTVSLGLQAQTHQPAPPTMPEGYCAQQCNGRAVTPFNFIKRAQEMGDPNTGKPLGKQMSIPDESGAMVLVDTKSFFSELTFMESFAAGQCGESLNSTTSNEIIVSGMCPATYKILDDSRATISASHKQQGTQAMNNQQASDAFRSGTSSESRRQLNEELYCRLKTNVGTNAMANTECKPFNLKLGEEKILAVGMKSQVCKSFTSPEFVPEFQYPIGAGMYQCRRGLVPGTTTATQSNFVIGAWLFNKELAILRTDSAQVAILGTSSRHLSNNFFRGNQYCKQDITRDTIEFEESCPLARLSFSKSVTFPIGPIPLTVEAGVQGQLRVEHFSRVAPAWTNGRMKPIAETSGFASASINLLIIRAGVEASLLFLRESYDLFSLAAIKYMPATNSLQAGFYASEQLTGTNIIEALSGKISAFVAVPIPKFLGWRWKKFKFVIFEWAGLRTSGLVIDHRIGPKPIQQM